MFGLTYPEMDPQLQYRKAEVTYTFLFECQSQKNCILQFLQRSQILHRLMRNLIETYYVL